MGAPKGNNNAAKGKAWANALESALGVYEDEAKQIPRGTALRAIANKVIAAAIDGDHKAIQEIGNRLDGKPHQSLDVETHNYNHSEELSEAELERIAAGNAARGSDRAAEKASKSPKPH